MPGVGVGTAAVFLAETLGKTSRHRRPAGLLRRARPRHTPLRLIDPRRGASPPAATRGSSAPCSPPPSPPCAPTPSPGPTTNANETKANHLGPGRPRPSPPPPDTPHRGTVPTTGASVDLTEPPSRTSLTSAVAVYSKVTFRTILQEPKITYQ